MKRALEHTAYVWYQSMDIAEYNSICFGYEKETNFIGKWILQILQAKFTQTAPEHAQIEQMIIGLPQFHSEIVQLGEILGFTENILLHSQQLLFLRNSKFGDAL